MWKCLNKATAIRWISLAWAADNQVRVWLWTRGLSTASKIKFLLHSTSSSSRFKCMRGIVLIIIMILYGVASNNRSSRRRWAWTSAVICSRGATVTTKIIRTREARRQLQCLTCHLKMALARWATKTDLNFSRRASLKPRSRLLANLATSSNYFLMRGRRLPSVTGRRRPRTGQDLLRSSTRPRWTSTPATMVSVTKFLRCLPCLRTRERRFAAHSCTRQTFWMVGPESAISWWKRRRMQLWSFAHPLQKRQILSTLQTCSTMMTSSASVCTTCKNWSCQGRSPRRSIQNGRQSTRTPKSRLSRKSTRQPKMEAWRTTRIPTPSSSTDLHWTSL